MNEELRERIRSEIAEHAAAIEGLFVPGAKVTVLVRSPSVPGDADVLVTNDTDAEILAAIERRTVCHGELPNTKKWRMEVRRSRGAHADEWRLFSEGLDLGLGAEICVNYVEYHQLRRITEVVEERVDDVVRNYFGRADIPLTVYPFRPLALSDGWKWMKLVGDSR